MGSLQPFGSVEYNVSAEAAGNRVNIIPNRALYPSEYTAKANIVTASQPVIAMQSMQGNSNLSTNVADAIHSPLPWIIGGLILGYLGIHYFYMDRA